MKLSDLDLDMRLPKPPMILVAVMVIGVFVPMGVASAIWYKRNTFDDQPRVHIFQDMDNQARLNPQAASDLFGNGMAMQAPVPGTVAFSRDTHAPNPDMLRDDDLAYRGFEVDPISGDPVLSRDADGNETNNYLTGYPDIVTINTDFIALRGRDQFNVHCMTCHGEDGRGVGPTKIRWDELTAEDPENSGPLIPANLMDPRFAEAEYPNGRLFNTITHGQGTMGPIGLSISVRDRWAIVAWVRAMQQHHAGGAHDHDGDGQPDH